MGPFLTLLNAILNIFRFIHMFQNTNLIWSYIQFKAIKHQKCNLWKLCHILDFVFFILFAVITTKTAPYFKIFIWFQSKYHQHTPVLQFSTRRALLLVWLLSILLALPVLVTSVSNLCCHDGGFPARRQEGFSWPVGRRAWVGFTLIKEDYSFRPARSFLRSLLNLGHS